jgi:hypothetical protein
LLRDGTQFSLFQTPSFIPEPTRINTNTDFVSNILKDIWLVGLKVNPRAWLESLVAGRAFSHGRFALLNAYPFLNRGSPLYYIQFGFGSVECKPFCPSSKNTGVRC